MAGIMKMEHDELQTHNQSFKEYKNEINDAFNKIKEELNEMANAADIAGGLSFFGDIVGSIDSVVQRYNEVMDSMTNFIDNQLNQQKAADEEGSEQASQIGSKFEDLSANFKPQG